MYMDILKITEHKNTNTISPHQCFKLIIQYGPYFRYSALFAIAFPNTKCQLVLAACLAFLFDIEPPVTTDIGYGINCVSLR